MQKSILRISIMAVVACIIVMVSSPRQLWGMLGMTTEEESKFQLCIRRQQSAPEGHQRLELVDLPNVPYQYEGRGLSPIGDYKRKIAASGRNIVACSFEFNPGDKRQEYPTKVFWCAECEAIVTRAAVRERENEAADHLEKLSKLTLTQPLPPCSPDNAAYGHRWRPLQRVMKEELCANSQDCILAGGSYKPCPQVWTSERVAAKRAEYPSARLVYTTHSRPGVYPGGYLSGNAHLYEDAATWKTNELMHCFQCDDLQRKQKELTSKTTASAAAAQSGSAGGAT